MTLATAYPLQWPAGWKRATHRKRSRFGEVTFARARDELLHELGLLGAKRIVLSSDVPLRQDGLPYGSVSAPRDPGVAVYFILKDRPMVFACDEWTTVTDNVWAIRKTIDAIRGIRRWGASDMLERAFAGFASLPAPERKKHWREVLKYGSNSIPTRDGLTARRNELARAHHPDRGGDARMMAEINRAFDEAMGEVPR